MKAYKCDVCGKLYPYSVAHEDRDYQIKKWGQTGSTIAKFAYLDLDICDECYTSFLSWVKMREDNTTNESV